jgi:tartronate-semialdehyde synthase
MAAYSPWTARSLRVTNIAMGTEIDNIVEFEEVLDLPLDETPASAVAMPKEKLEPV